MTPPDTPHDRSAELAAELDRVRQREASFRARSLQESFEYRKTVKAQVAELKALNDRAAERDAYVHRLHLAREADARELRQAVTDLESFVVLLREAEAANAARQRSIDSMQASWGWKLAAPIRALLPHRPPSEAPAPHADVPGVPFTYFLRTSPYRIYRTPAFTLEGWAFPDDGRTVVEVRARVDGKEFPGTYGLEEPEVVAQHAVQPNNPRPGLRLPFQTTPGRHHLSLEARLEGAGWVSFLTTPIWADHGRPPESPSRA